ncbi:uncharacterized protein LOC118221912 isoform X4 [Anguilla anguilla]|uniref:uncharacterized protein LOC118221912 isoform X4 n=1 Tax=Anguilla anguilla TaxID=7936 RepID=UPI0015AA1F4A|nr:uncharacterized protein LOC118221912 isoform X4 [Anguilla anguilla]XP_035263239.1 uncharacterized protein LOC118221912 isoform X4 [Anguilla anguilla]
MYKGKYPSMYLESLKVDLESLKDDSSDFHTPVNKDPLEEGNASLDDFLFTKRLCENSECKPKKSKDSAPRGHSQGSKRVHRKGPRKPKKLMNEDLLEDDSSDFHTPVNEDPLEGDLESFEEGYASGGHSQGSK